LDEVWITGIGVVSPIGCGRDAFRQGLLEGKSGIRPIDRFDTSPFQTQLAALVDGFNARKLAPTLDVRRADLLTRYAMVAAGLAFQDSQFDLRTADCDRLGLVMGLTYGSITVQDDFQKSLVKDGVEKMSAKYFPSMVLSTIGGQVSQAFKLRGINNTVVGGITSGLTALVHACDLLRSDPGQDAIAVVAADEVGSLYYDVFHRRGWLAKDRDGQRLNAYAAGHGYIVGEGGGALILERASSARRRGAKPLAKIAGVGATADAFAYRHLNPSATYLVHAIQAALSEAGLSPAHIDWLIGHGRGLPTYDERELAAWSHVFGEAMPPLSCLMGNVGVTPASSGIFSVAAALLGMQHGEAYPVASIENTADTIPALIRGAAKAGQFQRVLVAGSTEHGNNHALVLQRVD
jgi:3-oxoacyl-[acyl-carrier-protein] synthase II